jgi:nucleoside-diphosphate-sugar epimerase
MMYMPDALEAAINLMEADPAKLLHRNSFNVTAMSFDPEMIAAEIRKHIPAFTMDYNVEPMKQGIANSWPNSMDDSCARDEWGWKPNWNLESMTKDMLKAIREKQAKGLI